MGKEGWTIERLHVYMLVRRKVINDVLSGFHLAAIHNKRSISRLGPLFDHMPGIHLCAGSSHNLGSRHTPLEVGKRNERKSACLRRVHHWLYQYFIHPTEDDARSSLARVTWIPHNYFRYHRYWRDRRFETLSTHLITQTSRGFAKQCQYLDIVFDELIE